ncbi:MAG: hypothetical protein IT337_11870 [Thermomicrobiales bacterium]|nr:hypothetical protein [Thermomicrobiales bacterium]
MNPGNERSVPGAIARRSWVILGAAIAALFVAIAVAGAVALAQSEGVRATVQQALTFDIEVEDEGEDIQIAALNLRHLHDDIASDGPSDAALREYDQGYVDLLHQVGELEQLGIDHPRIVSPPEIRALAERYYAEFRPAIAVYAADPAAFAEASAAGLQQLDRLDSAAQGVDQLGELLAAASLERVQQASATERWMLIAVLSGVALVGVALIAAAARVLAGLQGLYAREQAATHALARTLQTKNDFIADASHELRTPLAVIQGNAGIGLATPGDPLHREVLEDIAAEAARMGALVNDLLFLARSDAGAPVLEREFTTARWLVRRVASPAERLARRHGALLVATGAVDGYLEVDPARLEQAVLILVDNAARYAPPGSRVMLESARVGDRLAIAVADAGPGIPPDELPHIFDRFYHAGDRRGRRNDGSGLGLSIARSIVQAHGGSISAESRLGVGTRMTILLPLAEPPNGETEPTLTLTSTPPVLSDR